MKVLLQMMMILYISQYMLISNVDGINLSKDDLSCKPGEGIGIFASGLASQCSGDNSITTKEECKAAADYNKNNKIDTNDGFSAKHNFMNSDVPPGCIHNTGMYNKYYFHGNSTSTEKCSENHKCVCFTIKKEPTFSKVLCFTIEKGALNCQGTKKANKN